MKVIKAIGWVLLTVWMLPQNIAGAVVLPWFALFGQVTREKRAWRVKGKRWGASLGWFIFVGDRVRDIPLCIKHEGGHQIQSKILGPLYLIVIGIPSAFWAANWSPSKGSYYEFWTERWADSLAGIVR